MHTHPHAYKQGRVQTHANGNTLLINASERFRIYIYECLHTRSPAVLAFSVAGINGSVRACSEVCATLSDKSRGDMVTEKGFRFGSGHVWLT